MSHHEINQHIDRLKESFLCAAARGGRIQECASLIEFGAEIEWHENNDDTPLLAAVRNGHQDCAALLLAHGASADHRDRDGNTVIHLAAARGDESMASLFSPNAYELSLSTNNDGMTAIDVAVDRGSNSFAEHLNNLLYEVGEEKDDPLASGMYGNVPSIEETSVVGAIYDSENDLDDEYESNETSFSILTDGNELQHTSTSTTIDEEISIVNPIEITDEYGSRVNTDCTDPDALMKQLRNMTQLAHTQSRDLYKTKYALSELMQEHNILKDEIAIFRAEDDSNLAQKSLAELNSLEEQIRCSLERVVKAKEVASSNLEDERVCVICREKTKSVLFMDCRHLCVCKDCGHLDVLVQCPLCRQTITERINVFA
mmetsp:Transcript_5422/g.13575  ORF Transcript_5422/g.13575 Transcript_5422/m.13575 type:complete len:372 (+) Transcript_5422:57-1172(+)